MITGLFISLAGVVFGGLASLAGTIPVPSPDGFMGPIATGVAIINNHLIQMDHWVPISSAGPVIATTAVFMGASIGLRLFRLVLSAFTGGGPRT